MRQKRAKAYKRLMALYSQVFGFRPPFQVLVASDLLIDANHKGLEVSKQLQNCVQGECKPMITQCSVEALYRLGKEFQPVVDIAKTFERRRCNHREALPESECLVDVVGPSNKHRYTLALQDGKQRAHFRAIPGIPIIHFNDRGVIVMELPSQATLRKKELDERGKLTEQIKLPLDLPNVVATPVEAAPAAAVPPRRKVKGPNPLSVRKKKPEGGAPPRPRKEGAARLTADRQTQNAENDDDDSPPERSGKRTREDENGKDADGAQSAASGDDKQGPLEAGSAGGPKKRKRKRPNKAAVAA